MVVRCRAGEGKVHQKGLVIGEQPWGAASSSCSELIPDKHLDYLWVLCKAKRQYLLTCKVNRYCLLALHGSVGAHTLMGLTDQIRILSVQPLIHAQLLLTTVINMSYIEASTII